MMEQYINYSTLIMQLGTPAPRNTSGSPTLRYPRPPPKPARRGGPLGAVPLTRARVPPSRQIHRKIGGLDQDITRANAEVDNLKELISLKRVESEKEAALYIWAIGLLAAGKQHDHD